MSGATTDGRQRCPSGQAVRPAGGGLEPSTSKVAMLSDNDSIRERHEQRVAECLRPPPPSPPGRGVTTLGRARRLAAGAWNRRQGTLHRETSSLCPLPARPTTGTHKALLVTNVREIVTESSGSLRYDNTPWTGGLCARAIVGAAGVGGLPHQPS